MGGGKNHRGGEKKTAQSSTSLLDNDGWFSEKEVLWPGQKMSLKMKSTIYEGKSKFQNLAVFDSETYGRVLVLDGVIQLTERDEMAYHEMMAHVPLFAHNHPQSVLIVGGGDGGIVREVSKHPNVKNITLCEIDPAVCDIAKKYFIESTASHLDDPRLKIVRVIIVLFEYAIQTHACYNYQVHEDAAAYLRNLDAPRFDVIISDSSDPVGPASTLFESEFYASVRRALLPGGIACMQCECIWLHLDLIHDSMRSCAQYFAVVDYAFASVPTYPSGQIGFLLCAVEDQTIVRIPNRINDIDQIQKSLRYYSPEVHRSCFQLPHFAERKVSVARRLPKITKNSLSSWHVFTIVAAAAGVAIASSFARRS